MKMKWSVLFVVAAQITAAQTNDAFDTFFANQTLRIDYFHSGTAMEEHIAIDQILTFQPYSRLLPLKARMILAPTSGAKPLSACRSTRLIPIAT